MIIAEVTVSFEEFVAKGAEVGEMATGHKEWI